MRISSKLGAPAALAVLLAALTIGVIYNGGTSVTTLVKQSNLSAGIVRDLRQIQIDVEKLHSAHILLANPSGDMTALKASTQAAASEALTLLDKAIERAPIPANKERFQQIRAKVENYAKALLADPPPPVGQLVNDAQGKPTSYVHPLAAEASQMLVIGVGPALERSIKFADQVFADTSALIWNAALLCAGIIALILISAAISIFNVAKPIAATAAMLSRLAEGDKSADSPYSARKDEVGDMARSAVTFRDSLLRMDAMEEERVSGEAQAQERRQVMIENLASEFNASIGQIVTSLSRASGEMETAALSLQQTTHDTRKGSAEAAAMTDQSVARFSAIASASEELAASVQTIGEQVSFSSRIAKEAVDHSKNASGRINQLNQSAASISGFVEVISAIAGQTNLLALNATIEAARAGEAGKGFAVVAEEVKRLADQTAKATEEIQAKINEIQHATVRSVQDMVQIDGVIGNVDQATNAIATSVEQQSIATHEIAGNIEKASADAKQTSAAMVKVDETIGSTQETAEHLLTSAQALGQQSRHLSEMAERFVATLRAA